MICAFQKHSLNIWAICRASFNDDEFITRIYLFNIQSDYMGCLGSNLGGLHVRRAPFLRHYHSGHFSFIFGWYMCGPSNSTRASTIIFGWLEQQGSEVPKHFPMFLGYFCDAWGPAGLHLVIIGRIYEAEDRICIKCTQMHCCAMYFLVLLPFLFIHSQNVSATSLLWDWPYHLH